MTSPSVPASRVTATIIRLYPGYAHAIDEWAVTYFIFHNAVSGIGRYGWNDLREGSQVKLTPIQHPKGPRGIEVEIVDV